MNDKHPFLEKFLREGGSALTDTEYLTLLLSYCGKLSAEESAEKLLSLYGSFSAAADADPKMIESALGSADAAVILRLVSRLSAVCAAESHNAPKRLKSPDDAKKYFSGRFIGVSRERILLAAADKNMRITACEFISAGDPTAVSLICRETADFVLRRKTRLIFIAHNHPIGDCAPSAADISATESITAALSKLGTAVADHIIIGTDGVFSMRESGICSSFGVADGYVISPR